MHSQKKFLFIDDDADDRDFFCSTMEMIDPSVQCFFAKDGIDALDQLNGDNQFTPDYIFIDMNMPRMDGRECLLQIRQIHRLKDSQVYIYSTTVNPKINDEVIANGAAGILVKPSTINDLSKLLQEVLKEE
ncbi:MAG TPA: response regulator [Flavobacterium sp.]|jgi:CheY-like chemotaxis protein